MPSFRTDTQQSRSLLQKEQHICGNCSCVGARVTNGRPLVNRTDPLPRIPHISLCKHMLGRTRYGVGQTRDSSIPVWLSVRSPFKDIPNRLLLVKREIGGTAGETPWLQIPHSFFLLIIIFIVWTTTPTPQQWKWPS